MADSWIPTVKDWVNGAVITEANLDEEIRDRMTAIFNALTADASADSDIWHGHKTGTLASRPAAAKAGRLYYATDLGVMFHDNGTRWDILSVNHRIADHFFDDFWWNATTGSVTYQDLSTGSGSITETAGSSENDSIRPFSTNTTTSSRAGLQVPDGTSRAWDTTRVPAIWQCRVRIDSASRLNEEIFMGLFQGQAAAGSDLDAATFTRIGFQKSDAGTESDWNSVTANAAAPILNAITGLKDAAFHFFEIVVRTASAIDFYVDGTLKHTHSTGIPSTQLRMGLYIDNTTTADKILAPDSVEFVSARV